MKEIYRFFLTFKKKKYDIGLIPNGDGFDIELRCNKKISGDEFQGLRNYLEAEGYFDQAREWCNS